LATNDPSGKIIAPDGTTEALQKYLELQTDWAARRRIQPMRRL